MVNKANSSMDRMLKMRRLEEIALPIMKR